MQSKLQLTVKKVLFDCLYSLKNLNIPTVVTSVEMKCAHIIVKEQISFFGVYCGGSICIRITWIGSLKKKNKKSHQFWEMYDRNTVWSQNNQHIVMFVTLHSRTIENLFYEHKTKINVISFNSSLRKIAKNDWKQQ